MHFYPGVFYQGLRSCFWEIYKLLLTFLEGQVKICVLDVLGLLVHVCSSYGKAEPDKTTFTSDISCKLENALNHLHVWWYFRKTRRIHQKLLFSCWWLIARKGYSLKPAKGSSLRQKSEAPSQELSWSFLNVAKISLFLGYQHVTTHLENCQQEKRSLAAVWSFLLGDHHVGMIDCSCGWS